MGYVLRHGFGHLFNGELYFQLRVHLLSVLVQDRAMDKYLKHILIFSIGLIILNILAYIFISKPVLLEGYLVPADSLRSYHSYLFADSHGAAIRKNLKQYGIFNFSFESDNYCDIYNKISFLYDENISLDTVLISVDDHTLSPYRERINNLNRSIFYSNQQSYTDYSNKGRISFYVSKYILPYLPLFNTSNSRLFSYYLLSILLPENRPSTTVENPDTKKETEGNSAKVSGAEKRPEENLSASQDRMAYQFPEGEKSFKLEGCLENIIQLCQQHKTVVVGIKFPLSANYLLVLDDKSYHADRLLAQYDITTIDLKYIFVESDHLFKDPDHVNQKGAKEFSFLLMKKLHTRK